MNLFEDALREAMPGVKICHKPPRGPVPEGYTEVNCSMKPVADGLLMCIRFGRDEPHVLKFADEAEAAEFVAWIFSFEQSPFGLWPPIPDRLLGALSTW